MAEWTGTQAPSPAPSPPLSSPAPPSSSCHSRAMKDRTQRSALPSYLLWSSDTQPPSRGLWPWVGVGPSCTESVLGGAPGTRDQRWCCPGSGRPSWHFGCMLILVMVYESRASWVLDSALYRFDLPLRKPHWPSWSPSVSRQPGCRRPQIDPSVTCDFLLSQQEPLLTQGCCPDAGAGAAAQEDPASGNVAMWAAGGQSSVQAMQHRLGALGYQSRQ